MHDGALGFAVVIPLLDVLALVELDLALAHSEENFHLPVLPVEGEGEDCIAFDGGEAEQFANLSLVQDMLGLMSATQRMARFCISNSKHALTN